MNKKQIEELQTNIRNMYLLSHLNLVAKTDNPSNKRST